MGAVTVSPYAEERLPIDTVAGLAAVASAANADVNVNINVNPNPDNTKKEKNNAFLVKISVILWFLFIVMNHLLAFPLTALSVFITSPVHTSNEVFIFFFIF